MIQNWVNIWKGDGRQRQVEFSLLPSILRGPIFSAPQLLEEVSTLWIPGPPPSQAFLRGVWDCGADRQSRMMNGSTVRVVGCRTWNRNHKSKPSRYWYIESRVEKEGGKEGGRERRGREFSGRTDRPSETRGRLRDGRLSLFTACLRSLFPGLFHMQF